MSSSMFVGQLLITLVLLIIGIREPLHVGSFIPQFLLPIVEYSYLLLNNICILTAPVDIFPLNLQYILPKQS